MMESTTHKPANLSATSPKALAYDLGDWHTVANHPALAAITHATRMVARGLVLFAFSFVEIIAELLAPIVLVFGVGWAMLPGIVSFAGPEGQARDFVTSVVQAIPREIHLGRTVVTPTSLIVEGVLLVALVALCRTVQALATTAD